MEATQEEFERLLKGLKRTYEKVYIAQIQEENYVFRLLTQREYEEILTWAPDEYTLDEQICQSAVVYPARINWQKIKAGAVPYLAKEIVLASGFASPEQIKEFIHQGQSLMDGFFEQTKTMIATAFPQYRFEEMDDWPIEKLTMYLARAEWALVYIHQKTHIAIQQEESPQTAPEQDINIIAQELREQGIDPMLYFGPTPKPDFVPFPLIGGSKLFQNEEVLALVRKQTEERTKAQQL